MLSSGHYCTVESPSNNKVNKKTREITAVHEVFIPHIRLRFEKIGTEQPLSNIC
jgi:hypothetical protein